MNQTRNTIGVLKLNTRFPRLVGDIGNPDSFRYPVQYLTVTVATPDNITTSDKLAPSVQTEFLTAAEQLIDSKVSVITTSCGFLSTMQSQLAALSTTPVICSSLALLPLLSAVHGGAERLGILTFNRETLGPMHTSGISPGAIEGLLPGDALRQVISEDLPQLDRQAALGNALAACDRLVTMAPQISAIVLECTNLSPYKNEIRQHARRPVYDIVDAIHWLLDSQPVPS